jgi:hypothetical protein
MTSCLQEIQLQSHLFEGHAAESLKVMTSWLLEIQLQSHLFEGHAAESLKVITSCLQEIQLQSHLFEGHAAESLKVSLCLVNFMIKERASYDEVLLRGVQFTFVQRFLQLYFFTHYCCDNTRKVPHMYWPHLK